MKDKICSQCEYSSDNSPYRRLFKLDNKLLCRDCTVKIYGYEETLKRLSQEEGFTCDFCHEKRVIGFNTPLSNKIIEGKTKCGICYYQSKSVECCEILSLFASQVKKNIISKEEEEWFNDFTFRFFEALQEKNKLCYKCLAFLAERNEKI
jgi:hypothetical protein